MSLRERVVVTKTPPTPRRLWCTLYRVLRRRGLHRLDFLDRPTGRVIRRIVQDHPGELVHMDIKKLGRIPRGGGWRAHGWETRHQSRDQRVGYAFVHSIIDGFS